MKQQLNTAGAINCPQLLGKERLRKRNRSVGHTKITKYLVKRFLKGATVLRAQLIQLVCIAFERMFFFHKPFFERALDFI